MLRCLSCAKRHSVTRESNSIEQCMSRSVVNLRRFIYGMQFVTKTCAASYRI